MFSKGDSVKGLPRSLGAVIEAVPFDRLPLIRGNLVGGDVEAGAPAGGVPAAGPVHGAQSIACQRRLRHVSCQEEEVRPALTATAVANTRCHRSPSHGWD